MMGRWWGGFIFVLAVVGWGSVGYSADEPRIAFVDAQKILDGTKAGKRAKGTMEEYVKSRQKVIDLDAQEIKRLDEELSKQGAVLSLEAKKGKEEDLQRKIVQYQRRAEELNREIQEKRAEVLKEFNKSLQHVLKKIAEKDGYLMVLDREDGGILLYVKESLDLTQKVIEEYDKIVP
jgi:outer membrane protein